MEHKTESHNANGGLLPFDPIILVQDVVKRWLVVLAAALIIGVGAYILTDTTGDAVAYSHRIEIYQISLRE